MPHLAALRYKDSGLTKRADWEQVWELQRQEDALPDEKAKREFRKSIPVPPKYTSADFAKTGYWRHRGRLDVPKERFISYPGASRDGDPTLLIGWAGWDHREQAQAWATLIVAREQEDGWDATRLLPLVAGLREILPWVRQWHGEFDQIWGASPAGIYAGFLAETTNRLRLTDEALTSRRPPKTTRGRKAMHDRCEHAAARVARDELRARPAAAEQRAEAAGVDLQAAKATVDQLQAELGQAPTAVATAEATARAERDAPERAEARHRP